MTWKLSLTVSRMGDHCRGRFVLKKRTTCWCMTFQALDGIEVGGVGRPITGRRGGEFCSALWRDSDRHLHRADSLRKPSARSSRPPSPRSPTPGTPPTATARGRSAASAPPAPGLGTRFHPPRQRRPLLRRQRRRLARRLAVDQAIRSLGIDAKHPVPHDLQPDPAHPTRAASVRVPPSRITASAPRGSGYPAEIMATRQSYIAARSGLGELNHDDADLRLALGVHLSRGAAGRRPAPAGTLPDVIRARRARRGRQHGGSQHRPRQREDGALGGPRLSIGVEIWL